MALRRPGCGEDEGMLCPICLDRIYDHEILGNPGCVERRGCPVVRLYCDHLYHVDCLKKLNETVRRRPCVCGRSICAFRQLRCPLCNKVVVVSVLDAAALAWAALPQPPAYDDEGLTASSSTAASQLSQATPGGGHLQVQSDDTHGFRFADAHGYAAGMGVIEDPADDLPSFFSGITNNEQLRQKIHPPGLFDGLSNEETTYQTILSWLQEAFDDRRSHREIGGDRTFSIRNLTPGPHRKAITAVARREGWTPEALLQGLMVNTGWLEHHCTRLLEREDDQHGRTPNLPAFGAGDPSARKSSLKRYITKILWDCPAAPDEIRSGLIASGDGTIRGHRNNLLQFNRSGTVGDEVTSIYECGPLSEHAKGIHWIPRQKMNTYVNCECDAVITAQGPIHLENYAFVHYVLGQPEGIEHAWRPSPIGVSKRYHVCFMENALWEPNQKAHTSRDFIKSYHEWLCCVSLPTKRRVCLDNFSQSMWRKVQQAIDEFLRRRAGSLNTYFVQKLRYADSDVLKMGNVMMRMCQFNEHLAGRAKPELRTKISLYELAHALHNWRRQMRLHNGFYRSVAEREPNGWGRLSSSLVVPDLTTSQLCQRVLLQDARCKGEVSTSSAREWMKHKLGARGVSDYAGELRTALETLEKEGVINVTKRRRRDDEGGETEGEARGRPRCRRVLTFEKKTWPQVEKSARAMACVTSLGLGADYFEN